jgi:hypothetical protein
LLTSFQRENDDERNRARLKWWWWWLLLGDLLNVRWVYVVLANKVRRKIERDDDELRSSLSLN